MDKLRILVADGHEFTREAYASVLEGREQIEVVGVVSDGKSAVKAVSDLKADVALIDAETPIIDGVQTAREIKAQNPAVGIVLLSSTGDPSAGAAFMRDWPDGKAFLRTQSLNGVDDLVRAITGVAQGRTMLDGGIVQALSERRSGEDERPVDRLTPRERQILSAIAFGATNATIATRLNLAPRTVENYIGSIFAKLGIRSGGVRHSRVQATLLYLTATGQLQPVDTEDEFEQTPVFARAS